MCALPFRVHLRHTCCVRLIVFVFGCSTNQRNLSICSKFTRKYLNKLRTKTEKRATVCAAVKENSEKTQLNYALTSSGISGTMPSGEWGANCRQKKLVKKRCALIASLMGICPGDASVTFTFQCEF